MSDDGETTYERTVMRFDGNLFARGWASVALAASDDPERLALFRSTCVEVYERGVQLVSADGYMILRTWLPEIGNEGGPPSMDEAPLDTFVALDPFGRGVNLVQWVLKETSKKDAIPLQVVLEMGVEVGETVGMTPAFGGMERRGVTLTVPGQERVHLGAYEAAWIDWRALLGQFRGEQTPAIALNPEILGRLVKLGKIFDHPLVWTFGGTDRVALIEVRDSVPWVAGGVMPVRLTPDELEFAEHVASAPEEGDLLSSILDEVAEGVNAGALDQDGLEVRVTTATP